MILGHAPLAFLVACLVALTPACSKKKDSGSSSGKGEEEEEDDDLSDDGGTSTKKTSGPCDASLMEEDTAGDCDGGGVNKDPEPDSDFFAEFVTPPKMKNCNEQGFVYLRCTDECSPVKTPAAFKCDRAGIEAIFSTVQGAKEDLTDYLDAKKYFIDQCGVTAASKPFVALACFTTGDGKCVDKDALDTKDATAETHFLTTDTGLGSLCPDQ